MYNQIGNMAKEKLFLNTLTFDYPSKPVRFYFSQNDDAERKSTRLKSPVLVPKEVKQTQKYIDLFAGCGGESVPVRMARNMLCAR